MALRTENVRAWHEVEADFNEREYQAVRDRQMRELELEDDVMGKVPIRCVLLVTWCCSSVLKESCSPQKHACKALQGVL